MVILELENKLSRSQADFVITPQHTRIIQFRLEKMSSTLTYASKQARMPLS